MANQVCHVEFVSDDVKAGAEFLSKLFGWETRPDGDEYISWRPGSDPVGGAVIAAEDWQSGQRCVVYIQVEDIEKTLDDVEAKGGRLILAKTKISDEHGFYGLFATPDGTIIGVWNRT